MDKIIKVEYLRDVMYFDTFDALRTYYGHEEVTSIDELREVLIKEADGMAAPEITEI